MYDSKEETTKFVSLEKSILSVYTYNSLIKGMDTFLGVRLIRELRTLRKHTYIILTPLNPTFIQ